MLYLLDMLHVCYIYSIENTIITRPEKVHSRMGADLYFLAESAFLMEHITEKTSCWFQPFVQS